MPSSLSPFVPCERGRNASQSGKDMVIVRRWESSTYSYRSHYLRCSCVPTCSPRVEIGVKKRNFGFAFG